MIIHNNFKIGSSYFFCMDSKLKKDITYASDRLKPLISNEFDRMYLKINSKPFNFMDLCKLCTKGTIVEGDINKILTNHMLLLSCEYAKLLDSISNISGDLTSEKTINE